MSTARPDSERATLAYLAEAQVPVVPSVLVRTSAEAVDVARHLDGPVAIKVASKDIAHKTDMGGVQLNVCGDQAVSEAFTRIQRNVESACPEAQVDGQVVSPMRGKGVELFVGTLRDAQWGPVLAVGLGGIWVEALQDTSLRLLPVTPQEVLQQLAELRASKLLDGFRGAPSVDREALAGIIARIGNAALALGPDLVSLEVNPLWSDGLQIEALDALAVWDIPDQKEGE